MRIRRVGAKPLASPAIGDRQLGQSAGQRDALAKRLQPFLDFESWASRFPKLF